MFLLRVAFIIWWVYNTLFIFREKRWFFGLKYVWRWWHDMYFLCDLFSLSQFLFFCEKHEAQVPQVFLTFIFNNWYRMYNKIPSVEVFVHWHAFRRRQELNFKTVVHIYHASVHSEIFERLATKHFVASFVMIQSKYSLVDLFSQWLWWILHDLPQCDVQGCNKDTRFWVHIKTITCANAGKKIKNQVCSKRSLQ